MISGVSLSEPYCREVFEIFSKILLYIHGMYAIPYTLVVFILSLPTLSMWLCMQIISPSGGGAYALNETASAWRDTEIIQGPQQLLWSLFLYRPAAETVATASTAQLASGSSNIHVISTETWQTSWVCQGRVSQRIVRQKDCLRRKRKKIGSGIHQRHVVTILLLAWPKLCDLPVNLLNVCS